MTTAEYEKYLERLAGYADLGEKEKEVVDSFNGTGEDGSGEKAYTKIHENQTLYLSAPKGADTMLALGN